MAQTTRANLLARVVAAPFIAVESFAYRILSNYTEVACAPRLSKGCLVHSAWMHQAVRRLAPAVQHDQCHELLSIPRLRRTLNQGITVRYQGVIPSSLGVISESIIGHYLINLMEFEALMVGVARLINDDRRRTTQSSSVPQTKWR